MKKYMHLFLLVLLVYTANSQIYFSERYNYGNFLSMDFSHTLLPIEDGYIVPGGYGYRDSLYNRGGLIKIDRYGNELIKKQIVFQYEGSDICRQQGSFMFDEDSTGFYSVGMKRKYNIPNPVGVADYGMIFKFDLNLDTLWTISIGDKEGTIDSTYIFEHCDLLPNNELIIAGHVVIEGSNSKAMLLKTDSLGHELWRKYFSSGPYNMGINVISTPDGGFVLSAWKWTFGPQPLSRPYLIKTDSLGNEVWRKYFGSIWGNEAMYIVNSADNTIVGGYSYSDTMDHDISYNQDAIVKMTYDGTLLWEKKYGESTYRKFNSSVNVSSEGKIIVAGYVYGTFPQRLGYMLNVSPEGDSLWYREYEEVWGVNSNNYLYGVIPTDDGGYAAAGMVHPNGNQDLWVLKVDSLGCESFDYCWTSIPGVISVEQPGELQVFPNPATGSCTVAIPKENQFDTYTLFIYNLMGVKMEEIVVPSGEIQVVLNLSGYAPGLYSVVTSYKGSITGRGKFVVY